MIISKDLDREIYEKARKIKENPNYYKIKSEKHRASLRELGDIYSVWLENPNLRMEILKYAGQRTPEELKRAAKKQIKRVRDGWNYLNSSFIQKNIPFDYLDLHHIEEVAKRIDPFKNAEGYRVSPVKFGLGHTPPCHHIVEPLLERFFYNIKEGCFADLGPVEKSSLAHIYLTAIQPFNDGNKRTARLVQNKILDEFTLPPVVIHYGERTTYLGHLKDALMGFRTESPLPMKGFINYLGGKVNSALDDIIGDLNLHVI